MLLFLDSDYVLLTKIAKGNQNAFQTLYGRYKTHVFGLARRYLNQKAISEDIAQDVWMKVIEKSADFKPEGSVRSWILMITRNMCLNELSSKWSQYEEITLQEESEHVPAKEFSEEYWTEQKLEVIREALEQLPDRQRAALLMQYAEGLDMKEIAKALQLEVNAVKALLFRARKNLEGGKIEKIDGLSLSRKNTKKA